MELDPEVDESPKQASHKTIVTEFSCFRQREGEVSPQSALLYLYPIL